ncbi:sigma 54-interacting transcriptional regulator [Terriglobus sp. 2YAB30_2]|uniref:sigma-54-dependent Fis family transcriptional regulator n=1 Tax=Terriglobus sp. 2YAB30_2 TaxID=3233023 RepID=UPI003F94D6A0
MESTMQSTSPTLDATERTVGSLSSSYAAMPHVSRLILDGTPLPEVLAAVAQLAEASRVGAQCSIWLLESGGRHLYCAAAPSCSGFTEYLKRFSAGQAGGPLGAAVEQQKPIYVTDSRSVPQWQQHLDSMAPLEARALWALPFFAQGGQCRGVIAIHHREQRSPEPSDLEIIENLSSIACIAVEHHLSDMKLRVERDRLRLLLEITNSMASKLDLRQLVETLSTDLLRVMRCDFCALLLPNPDRTAFRLTTLYNPERRGILCDGMMIPNSGSICGRPFRTGKAEYLENFLDLEKEVAASSDKAIRMNYECLKRESFESGFYLPLLGRNGPIGTLVALNRSERSYEKDETDFLEQAVRQVALAVENALDYERALKERDKEATQKQYLEEEVRAEFGDIVGDSPALKAALDLVSIVAPTDSSTLILGETGTGKELIARAIHDLSARKGQPFIKLNCAAIPLGLLESELFGHERGAFTGAVSQKVGRFELAHRGTLFLDEVGDIPLELQAKLLRVLQEQEFERLGSNRTHKVDVRLVAATHRDLAAMVRQSTFRDDLYYRLRVFPIHIPPLRQRTEDIPKLVGHFLNLHAKRMNKQIDEIPLETIDALLRYRWPGNVRELQNFIERAVILSPHRVLRAPISELEQINANRGCNIPLSGLNELERDHILRALDASNWVIGGRSGAAVRLGMKRTSLVYRMQKLGIRRPGFSANRANESMNA